MGWGNESPWGRISWDWAGGVGFPWTGLGHCNYNVAVAVSFQGAGLGGGMLLLQFGLSGMGMGCWLLQAGPILDLIEWDGVMRTPEVGFPGTGLGH